MHGRRRRRRLLSSFVDYVIYVTTSHLFASRAPIDQRRLKFCYMLIIFSFHAFFFPVPIERVHN
jgi:hypothetical protein